MSLQIRACSEFPLEASYVQPRIFQLPNQPGNPHPGVAISRPTGEAQDVHPLEPISPRFRAEAAL